MTMEEKKLRPFNLEEAKQGKPVCTKDGRKARIICFDKLNDYYPIIALVDIDGKECIFQYTNNGEYLDGNENTSQNNLMMLQEKHEGWVNIYRGGKLDADYIYPTIEEALNNIFQPMRNKYIDTVKIEWEE